MRDINEKNINLLPPSGAKPLCPPCQRIKPTTWVCPDQNRTRHLSVYGRKLQRIASATACFFVKFYGNTAYSFVYILSKTAFAIKKKKLV